MKSPPRRALLVPVKNLENAKSRLDPLLTQSERRQLAWVMLEGLLEQMATLDAAWERAVVTNYDPAIQLAGKLGFRVIDEAEQVSESRSVDFASGVLAGEGVMGVLRIPLDLPLVSGTALLSLMEAAAVEPSGGDGTGERPATVLVPSRDGTGTNAVYRSPPTLFPSRFGPGSLSLHRAEALQAGCQPVIFPSDTIGLDIDDPGDIAELVRRGVACPTLDYLREIGIEGRLKGLR